MLMVPAGIGGQAHVGTSGQEVTAMTATSIPAAGPSGVLRMTWVRDQLAHVLDHSEADEPSGTWTNPRELHQTGALALVAWWTEFRNGCGRLAAGTA
jgi:hypothetical protein